MQTDVDLIVVGAGAGGLVASHEGVRRGAHTVLISDGPPGGDCTFTGCVPSKTLLSAASRGADFDDAMSAVHSTIDRIAATEDVAALRRDGIDVVEGRGCFVAPDTVSVDGLRFRAPRIVLATGSQPSMAPVEGLGQVDVLTNENLFELTSLPRHLLIIGGGPIGCEMALAFARLGSDVTLVERAERLLTRDEPEAGAVVAASLRNEGVDVRCGVGARSVGPGSAGAGSVVLRLDDGSELSADRLLVATGRAAVTEGLDPERADIRLDRRGAVVVDDSMATTTPGVWAVGDVTGAMQFTHAAGRMAMAATANAFSPRFWPAQRVDHSTIPWVTYVEPEVAHVGMSEDDAVEHGGRVAWLPLAEIDRALTSGSSAGFVKLIAGPKRVLGNAGGGRILGATIVAPRAGEMIQEVVLAMHTRMFTGRLAQSVHAYPSWSMGVQEAAAQFFIEYRGRTARPAGEPGARLRELDEALVST